MRCSMTPPCYYIFLSRFAREISDIFKRFCHSDVSLIEFWIGVIFTQNMVHEKLSLSSTWQRDRQLWKTVFPAPDLVPSNPAELLKAISFWLWTKGLWILARKWSKHHCTTSWMNRENGYTLIMQNWSWGLPDRKPAEEVAVHTAYYADQTKQLPRRINILPITKQTNELKMNKKKPINLSKQNETNN